MKRAILSGFGGAVALLSLAAMMTPAAADALSDIKARGTIKVAIDLGLPPYGTIDANLKPVGSDVETAELLAKDLGVKLEIVKVTGANRVPFLLTGQTDIVISSFAVNDERKKVIDFSKPYGVLQNIIAAPQSMKVTGFADLAGKRVVVTRGTTADKALTAGGKGADILRYDDDATLVTAVVSGQADIAANTPTVIATIKEKRPNDPLEVKFVMATFPYAIGLRKNEPATLSWLNGWVDENMKNGKLREIYKKWQGAELPATIE